MIYTVECSFADAGSEADWNRFYSQEKLPALISVDGFHSSQRFRALTPGCPTYLAAHSVDGLDVLTGEEYQRKGGGNFARWQQHITHWHRNLYAGLERMPQVGPEDWLALTATGPGLFEQLGIKPHAIQATALAKTPPARWLAVVGRSQLPDPADLPTGLHLYAAMTPQLTPPR
jgi:hypothetical protein